MKESIRYLISFNCVFLILFLSLEVIKLFNRISKASSNALLITFSLLKLELKGSSISMSWILKILPKVLVWIKQILNITNIVKTI